MSILIWIVLGIVFTVILFHYVTMVPLFLCDIPNVSSGLIPFWHYILALLFAPLLHSFFFMMNPIYETRRTIQFLKYKDKTITILRLVDEQIKDDEDFRRRVLALGLSAKDFKKFVKGVSEAKDGLNSEKILKILEE